jgi:hypothetical protein
MSTHFDVWPPGHGHVLLESLHYFLYVHKSCEFRTVWDVILVANVLRRVYLYKIMDFM